MGFIGLLLIALIIIFFTIFAAQQDQQGEAIQLIGGFVEVLGINFLLIIALIVLLGLLASIFPSIPGLVNIPMYGFGGLGVLQLLYVVPRSLYLRRRQRWAKLKGVIAGAVIVALLNGGCWFYLGGFGSG
jgi:Na+/proline symporter